MPELQNNFKPTASNITHISASRPSLKTVPIQKNDIIESEIKWRHKEWQMIHIPRQKLI